MPLILSNHDSFAGDRPWDRLGGDEGDYRLAASTYVLAARNPFAYYGEEVGMAGADGLSGDHALRTPMSWTSNTVTAGFTTGTPFRALSANVATHNVADETGAGDSLLEHYRGLYDVRNTNPVIAAGSLTVLSGGGDPVLTLRREQGDDVAIVVVNYSNAQQSVDADTGVAGQVFSAVFGDSGDAASDAGGVLAVEVPARTAVVYVSWP
jgi:glycosidase